LAELTLDAAVLRLCERRTLQSGTIKRNGTLCPRNALSAAVRKRTAPA